VRHAANKKRRESRYGHGAIGSPVVSHRSQAARRAACSSRATLGDLAGLYRPDPSSLRRPLVIMHNGFDGSVEEMHFLGAWAAVERGYNVLAFDGLGQFGPLQWEAKTPREYMAASLDYTLAGGVAEAIVCPTLVCEAEDDVFFAGQPELLYDHLTCPKTLLRFTTAEGAGAHCQVSALRLAFVRIYDWLDDVLRRYILPCAGGLGRLPT
jgi:predicted alpha/beta-fold hydrolase